MRFAALLALLLGAFSCSPPTPKPSCGPSNCTGCCDASGECQVGNNAAACGVGGIVCSACTGSLTTCTFGVCGGAATGGGTATGGGGGSTTGGGGGSTTGGGGGSTTGGGGGSTTGGGGGSTTGGGGGTIGGGGGSTGQCAGTLTPCSGQCLDLLADVENCGACARACGQGQVCNRGTCAVLPDDCTTLSQGCGAGYFCDPVSKRCSVGCRLNADCPTGATCTGGSCACPMAQHACGQACVSNTATNSCGTSCTACPQPANSTATCASASCGFTCAAGYVMSGNSCVDVNECLTNNGGCSNNSACTNTMGSRTCACNTGFTGDGLTCADVNECATNNGGCDANATCTNTMGSRNCACNSGYSGNGTSCTDVNECLSGNGGCSLNATCTNTMGSRTCACNSGYSGNGLVCTANMTGGGGGATGGGGGTATGGGGGTTGGGTGVTGIAGVRDLIDQNADITIARPTITGAVVSAFKPAISGASNNDPVGFFLQSVQAGPAIFVAVDPATIPNLAVGNLIDLTVESANKLNSVRVVRSISNTTRSTTTPNPVPGLAASVNNVDFSVGSTLDTWESRLVTFSATVASDPATAGAAFKAVTIGTAGTPGSSGAMRLRMPATELDALQIGVGCTLQVTTGVPMWRFNGTAQPAPSLASEVQVMSCPGPRVVIAGATSASSVVVSFDRDLLGSSITTGAFTVATVGGTPLQVTGATLSSARTVTLTTATQASGTTYRVTVGTSVLSARGDAVTTSGNTATFAGATFSSCAPQVIISQVFTQNSSTWSQDYIELHNRGATAANLTGWSIQYQSAAGSTWSVSALNTILQPGGYYLVAMGGASTTGATLAPDTTGNLSFSGAAGKVALVSSTTPMTSGCPTGSWVDLVSYGSNSTFCAEGSSAPTPNSGTTLSRTDGVGCGDLNDNSVDFSAGSATPRSSSSTPVLCSCP